MMKRKVTTWIAVLSTCAATAQEIWVESDTIPFHEKIAHVFQHFDMSQATTGILLDKGDPLAPVEKMDGSNDAYTCDPLAVRLAYLTLWTSQLDSVIPDPKEAFQNYDDYDTPVIPSIASAKLGGVYCKANQVKPNALNNGDIDTANGQVYNVFGRNPMEEVHVLAFSAHKKLYRNLSVSFLFREDFLVSNINSPVNSLRIDFGNGEGWQQVIPNIPLVVNWREYGTYTPKAEITLNNGALVTGNFVVHIKEPYPTPEPKGSFKFAVDEVFAPVTGVHSGGQIHIEYGCSDNGYLTKPLIIAEGWDPHLLIDDVRNYGWEDFELKILEENLGTPARSLLDILLENGYDLVFLDYNDGTDYIQRNAALLEEVIDYVNAEKARNLSNEPNVVFGESMGGLVARYALRSMELKGKRHQTTKYISLDTPHHGANLPVGIQAMLAKLYDSKACLRILLEVKCKKIRNQLDEETRESIQEASALLNAPATRQMLWSQFASSLRGPSLYLQFFNELDNMGMPQGDPGLPLENIAMSNGSIDGVPNESLLPGQEYMRINIADFQAGSFNFDFVTKHEKARNGLFSFTYPSFHFIFFMTASTKTDGIISVKALPYYKNSYEYVYTHHIRVKVLGFLTIARSIETVWAKRVKPLDTAPGGFEGSEEYTGELEQIAQEFNGFDFSLSQFTFVPTISALGITENSNNLDYDIRGNNVVQNNKTIFDEVGGPIYSSFADSTNNEEHASISIGGAHFLHQKLIQNGFQHTVLTTLENTSYNFGENSNYVASNYLANDLTVESGGILGINAAMEIGRKVDRNGFPNSNSSKTVKLTRGCTFPSNNIHVERGGKIMIGSTDLNTEGRLVVDQNQEFVLHPGSELIIEKGELYIAEGSSFFLHPGSTIRLNGNDASVVIDGTIITSNEVGNYQFSGSGGQFIVRGTNNWIIHPGQEIRIAGGAHVTIGKQSTLILVGYARAGKVRFTGDESVLDIRGKLDMKQGAELWVFSQGYLKIDVDWPGDFLTAEPGSRIWLSGSDPNDKILELGDAARIHQNTGLASFILENGKVELGRLDTDFPGAIRNVNFVSNNTEGGIVQVFGQPMAFEKCTFNNTELRGNLQYYGNPLHVNDCLFKNRNGYLQIYGKSLVAKNIDLEDKAGVVLDDLSDFTSYIERLDCRETEAFYTIVLDGIQDQNIRMTDSYIHSSGIFNDQIISTIGYLSGTGDFYMGCTEIEGASINFLSGHEINLNISGELGSGNNSLSFATEYNIQNSHGEVFANGGNNLFAYRSNKRVLGGELKTSSCKNYEMNNNQWFLEEGNEQAPPDNSSKFKVNLHDCPTYPSLYATDNEPQLYTGCEIDGDVKPQEPVLGCNICDKILGQMRMSTPTPGGFQIELVNEALELAESMVSDIEVQRNDPLAVELSAAAAIMLKREKSNAHANTMRKAFEIGKTAFGNIGAFNVTENPTPKTTQDFMHLLNAVSPVVVSASNYSLARKVEYAKASFLQRQGNFDGARDVLQSMACGVTGYDNHFIDLRKTTLSIDEYISTMPFSIDMVDSITTVREELKEKYAVLLADADIAYPSVYFTPSELLAPNYVQTYFCGQTSEEAKAHSFKSAIQNSGNASSLPLLQAGEYVQTVEIIDVSGRLMHKQKLTDGEKFIAPSLIPGMYLFKSYTNLKQQFTRKVIVQ